MEYNLNNRPRAKYPKNSITEKWFEGFEKQEQERLRQAEAKIDHAKHELLSTFWDGYIKAKKEILGE